MNTSTIAIGLALSAVLGLVFGLGVLSLIVGSFETYLGRPKLTLLNSKVGDDGLAFGFKWNGNKEPARINYFKVRLFNPFGDPTQVEVSKQFENKKSTFTEDLNMGPGLKKFLGAKGFEKARVMIEVGSTLDGVSFQFEMSGFKFKNLISNATETKAEYTKRLQLDVVKVSKSPISIPERSFIADRAYGVGPQLKIATNPLFAAEFAAVEASSGAASAEAVVNFALSKVWIEPGCIVCDACAAIYPEVFDVQANTCVIKPNAPLDDGLKVQEAAEACPVEVIKYAKV